jgi:superfamily II DNA helicase RecQ
LPSDDDDPSPPPLNQLALKNKDSNIERNSLTALRATLNNDAAQWTSPEQRNAIIATLKRESDVIAMLKTGGGKSMLAILPAIMEIDKAVVVVLPLKSLMTDWERKLKAMGVPFQVYNHSHSLSTNINLILVSADKARFKTWRQYLAELNEILPVSRMIFDEAHLALLSEDFRMSMQDLHELRQFSMQLVLLSATIPPSSIAALKATFGLLSTTIEIKESSNRPELEYIMRAPALANTLEMKAIQIVEQEQSQWTAKDRGLIFVTYIEDGNSLSERVSNPSITIHVY